MHHNHARAASPNLGCLAQVTQPLCELERHPREGPVGARRLGSLHTAHFRSREMPIDLALVRLLSPLVPEDATRLIMALGVRYRPSSIRCNLLQKISPDLLVFSPCSLKDAIVISLLSHGRKPPAALANCSGEDIAKNRGETESKASVSIRKSSPSARSCKGWADAAVTPLTGVDGDCNVDISKRTAIVRIDPNDNMISAVPLIFVTVGRRILRKCSVSVSLGRTFCV